ncbi:four helix bundle protein [Cryomorphaceae bacterium 1068]|nr:four helix bundle protein [Cryomorphaceae bacterium 1068]
MKTGTLKAKSYAFAVKVVKVGYQLIEKKEFILSKQLIRSATSIGANAEEANGAYSKKDFHHKISISYKEGREARYWIMLLRHTDWLDKEKAQELLNDLEELLRMMGASLRTMRNQTK